MGVARSGLWAPVLTDLLMVLKMEHYPNPNGNETFQILGKHYVMFKFGPGNPN